MSSGEHYDAVILGAGTSGLAAGSALEKAGKSYIIIDAKDEIGKPVRSTGAVSAEWVNRIGMPKDPSILCSDIKKIKFATDLGRSVKLRYDNSVGYVYDFEKYEKFLADKFSGKLNVQMRTKVLEISDNTVQTDNGTFSADYIVMALGPQSRFGKKLDRQNVLVAYEEIRKAPKRDDFDMILWFTDMAPGGYVWDFPNDNNSRKIGVCYYPDPSKKPKDVLAAFTERYPEIKGEMEETMAHQIPLGRPDDVVISGNRAYVGDMVNAVLNTTAGGLQGAFWSGLEAGRAIAAGDLSLYQQKWDQEIKPWLMRHHNIHRFMHKNGVRSINRLMLYSKFMTKSRKKKVFAGL